MWFWKLFQIWKTNIEKMTFWRELDVPPSRVKVFKLGIVPLSLWRDSKDYSETEAHSIFENWRKFAIFGNNYNRRTDNIQFTYIFFEKKTQKWELHALILHFRQIFWLIKPFPFCLIQSLDKNWPTFQKIFWKILRHSRCMYWKIQYLHWGNCR